MAKPITVSTQSPSALHPDDEHFLVTEAEYKEWVEENVSTKYAPILLEPLPTAPDGKGFYVVLSNSYIRNVAGSINEIRVIALTKDQFELLRTYEEHLQCGEGSPEDCKICQALPEFTPSAGRAAFGLARLIRSEMFNRNVKEADLRPSVLKEAYWGHRVILSELSQGAKNHKHKYFEPIN
jgi:hypothetical protein